MRKYNLSLLLFPFDIAVYMRCVRPERRTIAQKKKEQHLLNRARCDHTLLTTVRTRLIELLAIGIGRCYSCYFCCGLQEGNRTTHGGQVEERGRDRLRIEHTHLVLSQQCQCMLGNWSDGTVHQLYH